jgi:NADH:ubiquinone oxidoreductase subunit K
MVMRIDFFLVMAALLFTVGCVGVLIRRNVIVILMCIELMLNAVNINLIAFSHRLADLQGQVFTVFVITIAAGEAAVGLAIIIQLYRLRSTVNVDEVRTLNG